MAGFGNSGSVAFLPTQLFVPSLRGPKWRRFLQPPASRARGGSSARPCGVTHSLYVTSQKPLSPPPPMPLGRTRLIARPSEVGERVPSVSRGQVTHRSAPMEQGCVCVTGWQVRELLTRACGGPWRQVSRLPLVSSQPSTHKYLSWESKGYLRSPLRIQLASGVA